MNLRPLISIVMTCLFLTFPVAAIGDEPDAVASPERFGQLLRVGESVLLKPSSEHPVYIIQLLSHEQAAQVQAAHATYTDLQRRVAAINGKLETEKRLGERGALFVQSQSLYTEISGVAYKSRLAALAYEVAHVGEDFVTLKRTGRQKFVPLRSIREMVRSDSIDANSSLRSRKRSFSDAETRRLKQLRLRNARAAEVVEVVNKIFPDPKREMVIQEASNTLQITATREDFDQVQRLIAVLDAAVSDAKPTSVAP